MSSASNGTAVAVRGEVSASIEGVDRSHAVGLPGGAASSAMAFVANADAWWRIAKAIAASGMVKERKPEAILAKMLMGQEIGVPPMAAVHGIHHFDGKLSVGASTMLAVAIQKCGIAVEYVETSAEKAHLRFRREGWSPVDSVWTAEDTKRAGLGGKDNHRKYPEDMNVARATARGIRRIAPDLFAAVYATEEIGPVQGATVVSSMDQDVDALSRELGLIESEPAEEPGGHVEELIRIATERADQIPEATANRIRDAIESNEPDRIDAALQWLQENTEEPEPTVDELPGSGRLL